GKWLLGPAAERQDWDPPDPQGLAPLAQVVEVLEGTPQQEVLVAVQRGLYIRGRVLDPDGKPAAKIFVMGNAEVATWPLQTESGEDGAFALGPLVPGS